MDLKGNTFWEFRDRLNASRPRRTVIFKDKNLDWVDYAGAVTPAWHQWLRATRIPAPSIEEQVDENKRQEGIAKNAALADARWAAKPSLLNVGPRPPPDSGLQRDQKVGRGEVGADLGGKGSEVMLEARAHGLRKEDPWVEAEQEGFKAGEWDPNAKLPKIRSRGRNDR